MGSAMAERQMYVGVHLRTQVVDPKKVPCDVVRTGGALRTGALNIGVISFYARISTEILGGAVTDNDYAESWESMLILPASRGTRNGDHSDRKLRVVEAGRMAAFRTVVEVTQLAKPPEPFGMDRYVSDPLDVFAQTA